MDFEVDLTALGSKSSELDSMKDKINEIISEFDGGYLNGLSSTEIGSISSHTGESVHRLEVGYSNSSSWLSRYVSEFTSLEDGLAGMQGANGDSPVEFKETFSDLFTKATVPIITTEYRKEQEEKKKSGVLSFEVGKVPAPGVEANNIKRLDSRSGGRATLLDVQCNGVSLGQDGTITIKRGTTAKLTVQMPEEIEGVDTCKRTNYDGGKGWSRYVKQQNDPFVNKHDSSTYQKMRSYDWYITGNQTGTITLSQTALFSLTGKHRYGTYKGMVRVRVKIVD